MCVKQKKVIFPLCLFLMLSLIGKDKCQSVGNCKVSSSYGDDFEVSNLIGPKKIKRPKYEWEVKPPQDPKKPRINSHFVDNNFSGAKNLSDLFYNNEYGRD